MTDEHGLSKLWLEQCQGISWAVGEIGAFHKFYSDPSSIFGKSAVELQKTPDAALDPAARRAVEDPIYARAVRRNLDVA